MESCSWFGYKEDCTREEKDFSVNLARILVLQWLSSVFCGRKRGIYRGFGQILSAGQSSHPVRRWRFH